MKQPPIALIVIIFLAAAVVAYANYTPRSEQPALFLQTWDRLLTVIGVRGGGLHFDPPATLPDAREGEPYLPGGRPFSFCDPVTAKSDAPCPSLDATGRNPSGGAPPYQFLVGTGAAEPPASLVLETNGRLNGSLAAGTGGQRYEWVVCAIDAQGASVCRCVSLFVATPASTRSGAAPCAASGGGVVPLTSTARGTATGTRTATPTSTAIGTSTATATATRTVPPTATGAPPTGTAGPGPGPVGTLSGTWAGPDTQTDTACDYAGTVRLVLMQSGTTFSGTATYTLNLTRDKIRGACLPTRNYSLTLSGTMDGQAVTFVVGGAWRYTGTVDASFRAIGTVTSAGITTTDNMVLSRQ